MEVLVTFLGDDLDRPVVIGCLPNATPPPPFPLPAGVAKSGIRSKSTPGGKCHNEIVFDDTAAGEVLALKAQKEFVEEVGDDHSATVGDNRLTNIAGTDTLNVRSTRSLNVKENLREDVEGNHERFVMGSTKPEHFGNQEIIAFAIDEARIDGSRVRTVRADAVMTTAGHATMTIGTADTGEAQVQVSGMMALGAGKVCGSSVMNALRSRSVRVRSRLLPKGLRSNPRRLLCWDHKRFKQRARGRPCPWRKKHKLMRKSFVFSQNKPGLNWKKTPSSESAKSC